MSFMTDLIFGTSNCITSHKLEELNNFNKSLPSLGSERLFVLGRELVHERNYNKADLLYKYLLENQHETEDISLLYLQLIDAKMRSKDPTDIAMDCMEDCIQMHKEKRLTNEDLRTINFIIDKLTLKERIGFNETYYSFKSYVFQSA
jgi:hypothetical protein